MLRFPQACSLPAFLTDSSLSRLSHFPTFSIDLSSFHPHHRPSMFPPSPQTHRILTFPTDSALSHLLRHLPAFPAIFSSSSLIAKSNSPHLLMALQRALTYFRNAWSFISLRVFVCVRTLSWKLVAETQKLARVVFALSSCSLLPHPSQAPSDSGWVCSLPLVSVPPSVKFTSIITLL